MAKLTAAQERSIETVLYHLNRAHQYLMNDATVIARTKPMQTTTLDYVNNSGEVITAICKDIGSDIVGLETGIKYLENFVKMNSKQYNPSI